jgi:predicted tellurium resistance membrane protein TerC
LVLILGGLFLVAKATHEIHAKLEDDPHATAPKRASFASVVLQILLVDIVFSLHSVITAVGMVDEIAIMITAVVVSIGIMMAFAGHIGAFVERHPAIKILALSFLILIGVMLVAQGFDRKIDKGYIYFAMAFSLAVELLNMRLQKRRAPKPLGDGANSFIRYRRGPTEQHLSATSEARSLLFPQPTREAL